MPPAREVLTVFIKGEERPGINLFALRRPGAGDRAVPTDELRIAAEIRPFRLSGEAWEVLGWDLALDNWPRGEGWREFIRQALDLLVRGGAVVAWVAAEGFLMAEPPDLFDPASMSGAVLAYMTSAGEFCCPTDPDLPVKAVDDEALLQLRRHAQGLADAPA